MPRTRVVLFREKNGTTPVVEWLKRLPRKARFKCITKLERLRVLGHELRRPEADLLRDGIYELRIGFQGAHYRILYFFHGHVAVVVSHGLTKERAVPNREIDMAIAHKREFIKDPALHSNEEPINVA